MHKIVFLFLFFLSVFLAGCDSSSPQPARLTQTTARQNDNPVIARVDGVEITKSEVVEILLAGRGKTVLDDLALLQAVRNHAAQKGLTGSPEIIESEMNLILDDMAPGKSRNDQLDLFQYMLQSRGLTRPEFNLIVERQALLRRLVDPDPAVTEDLLLAEFDRLYGPKVQVRRLAVSSRRQLENVQNQLALGSDFTELVPNIRGRNHPPAGRTDAPLFRPRRTDPGGNPLSRLCPGHRRPVQRYGHLHR